MLNSLFKWVTPNQLTVGRIFSIPMVLVLIWWGDPMTNNAACLLFFFACMTDMLDGALARQRNEVTQLGKLLDPIADKMLVMSALIMLVSNDVADVVPTILITLREFAVGGLRSVAGVEGIVIPAVKGAKWKTVLQMLAIGGLLLYHDPFGLPMFLIGEILLWIAAVWTIWTGYAYFADYFKLVIKGRPEQSGE